MVLIVYKGLYNISEPIVLWSYALLIVNYLVLVMFISLEWLYLLEKIGYKPIQNYVIP